MVAVLLLAVLMKCFQCPSEKQSGIHLFQPGTHLTHIARFTAQHRVAQKAVLWLTERKGEQILTDTPIKFILMKLDPIRK